MSPSADVWRELLACPAFEEAWREVVEEQVTLEAVEQVWDRLLVSRVYCGMASDALEAISQAAADWAAGVNWAVADQATPDSNAAFDDKSFNRADYDEFQRVAVQHLIGMLARGVLAGVSVGLFMAHIVDEVRAEGG